MKEVSLVDDPANEIPGWMVAKSSDVEKAFRMGRPMGPDQTWDAAAADRRVREATGATEAPNRDYGSCFLYVGGDGEQFGDYKLLVCDVVDGDIKIMPRAVRAAASRLPQTDLPEADRGRIRRQLDELVGRGSAEKAAEQATFVGRLRGLLAGKEAEDVTKEELKAELDARDEALVEKLAAAVSKSSEPTAGEADQEAAGATEPEQPAAEEPQVPGVSAEDVAKMAADAIEAAIGPVLEVIDKALDRIAAVERALTIERGLDGQENGEEPQAPTLEKAFSAALKGRKVTLR